MSDNVPALVTDALAETRKATAQFIASSKADSTRRCYASDWADFQGWAATNGVEYLPAEPETVAIYLTALAQRGRKVSTIRRRLAAITHYHRNAGHASPTGHPGVEATVTGIARQLGSAPAKKTALTAEILQKVIRKIPVDLPGLRDRALLLLGFGGALRRSELVALEVRDVARHAKGIVLTLRKSKTDQVGAGKAKAIPTGKRLHIIEAVDAWLIAARIIDGPIFRGVRGTTVLPDRLGGKQVARVVKKRCAAAGIDPADFAGHSLRSGFATTAGNHGAGLTKIADHLGHAKLETTRNYVQVADAFKDHSGRGFL